MPQHKSILISWVDLNNDPYEREYRSLSYRLVDGQYSPGPTLNLLRADEPPFVKPIHRVVLFHASNERSRRVAMETQHAVEEAQPGLRVVLEEWQGKDGDNALFVWQEGIAHPIDQRVDEDWAIPKEDYVKFRLPKEFSIYTNECNCPCFVVADCSTSEGIWNKTVIIDSTNVKQGSMRKSDFKEYLKWLNSRKT